MLGAPGAMKMMGLKMAAAAAAAAERPGARALATQTRGLSAWVRHSKEFKKNLPKEIDYMRKPKPPLTVKKPVLNRFGPAGGVGAPMPLAHEQNLPASPTTKPYTWTKQKAPHKVAGSLLHQLNTERMIEIEKERDLPYFKAGDAIEIVYKVSTQSERSTRIRGMVLGLHRNRLSTSFRTLCTIGGTPVEFIMPLYSPLIQDLRLIEEAFLHRSRKRVRRSKIYYTREFSVATFAVKDGVIRKMRKRIALSKDQRRKERFEMLGLELDNDPSAIEDIPLEEADAAKAPEDGGSDEKK